MTQEGMIRGDNYYKRTRMFYSNYD